MTAIDIVPQVSHDAVGAHAEHVLSWNTKMMLTAKGVPQSALAQELGITRATMTNKMKGRITWSLADAVKTARFLHTTVDALLDDSLMRQMGVDTEKAPGEPGAHELLRLGLNQ